MKMIVSPHVDDEVLGCGGILDSNTHVLHLGLSENELHGNTNFTKDQRLEEFSVIKSRTNLTNKLLNHPVNNYRQQDLIGDIEREIKEIQPEEIYIPHPSYNQDHRESYEACLVALRPHDINHFVPKVFVYEQPQVLWNNNYREFKPTFFKEIDIDLKLELYLCLKSQVRNFRSPECVRSLAKIRGSQSRYEYAEAYEILRYVS